MAVVRRRFAAIRDSAVTVPTVLITLGGFMGPVLASLILASCLVSLRIAKAWDVSASR